jgi:hypothetical protein
MSGRKPDKFKLKPSDKKRLRSLVHDGQTPWRVVRRAQILLGRADTNQGVVQLSEKVAQDRSTIWRVCERYRQEGVQAALYDAPRTGHPPVFFQARPPIY